VDGTNFTKFGQVIERYQLNFRFYIPKLYFETKAGHIGVWSNFAFMDPVEFRGGVEENADRMG